ATVRPRMYDPLEPRDGVAEERDETLDLPAAVARLLERRPFERPGWAVEEADVLVVRADDPPHLRVGLLRRQVAPRGAVGVGLDGTVEELSGFVKARVVVSVNGGPARARRADLSARGAPARFTGG